jgi:hypothetical protein
MTRCANCAQDFVEGESVEKYLPSDEEAARQIEQWKKGRTGQPDNLVVPSTIAGDPGDTASRPVSGTGVTTCWVLRRHLSEKARRP